jgi:hypothetical protein
MPDEFGGDAPSSGDVFPIELSPAARAFVDSLAEIRFPVSELPRFPDIPDPLADIRKWLGDFQPIRVSFLPAEHLESITVAAQALTGTFASITAAAFEMNRPISLPLESAAAFNFSQLNELSALQASVIGVAERYSELFGGISAAFGPDQLSPSAKEILKAFELPRIPSIDFGVDSNALAGFSSMAAIAASPIPAWASAVASALPSPELAARFRLSGAARGIELLAQADAAATEAEYRSAVLNIIRWLQDLAKRLPRSRLSQELVINLFVFLVSFGIPQRQRQIDNRADLEWKKQTASWQHEQEQEVRILRDLVEELTPSSTSSDLLIPRRRVQIRASPKASDPVRLILPAGTLLREIQAEGRWVQVEYADPVEMELDTGWVFRRNLRHVEPDAAPTAAPDES